ncbi:hypothetical protein T492DRAFT_938862 [Pavlovales sp. CCMP2436]|nr:hypothetical protein T492DRAFT_938862 [Pavlovales sp. CCMP2436]|mmetsp:Transcript_7888/g.20329  ORF Transcript_7888/g.20329 Transcript_7888/m.20329 type:complete len:236 (-) Transcript_7888:529-1236(-)
MGPGSDGDGSAGAGGEQSGTMCFSASAPSEPSGTMVFRDSADLPTEGAGTMRVSEGEQAQAGDRSEWPKFMLNMNWLGFPGAQPQPQPQPQPGGGKPSAAQPQPQTPRLSAGGARIQARPAGSSPQPAAGADGSKLLLAAPPQSRVTQGIALGASLPILLPSSEKLRDKEVSKAKYDFSGKSLDEIETQLNTLDEQLERDIQTLRKKYQKRRKALNAAKLAKTAGAPQPKPAAVA